MTTVDFANVWKADDFKPFRIHTANGRTFDVPHRDFTWRSPGGRTVYVATSPRGAISSLDLLTVTELEEIESDTEAA